VLLGAGRAARGRVAVAGTKAQPTCLVCTNTVAGDQLVSVPYAGLVPQPIHRACLDATIATYQRSNLEIAGLLLRIHNLEAELARRPDDGRLHALIAGMRAALAPRLILKGGNGVAWWGCQVCQASSLMGPEAIFHQAGCVVEAEP
jgi:hypothetical protein